VKVLGDYKPDEKWSEPYDMLMEGKAVKVKRNLTTNEVKAVASGQTINLNQTPENKALTAAMEGTIKQILPGGKSYDAAQAAESNLATTAEALGAVKAGADQGALADFALQVRKLGERAGIPNAATAPTDQLSSILKVRVFHKLGGLGVAISDPDRRFMQEAAGDISKDPTAMRRLLALDAAASMKELARHNSRVKEMASREGFDFLLNNQIPINSLLGDMDPEFDQMVQNAMAGRPTTSAPSTAEPPKKKKEPEAKSKYGPPVKLKGW